MKYEPGNYKKVEVIWVDAEGLAGWSDYERFEEWADESMRECHTMGYLIRSSVDRIVVASSLAECQGGDGTKILRGWIKQINILGIQGRIEV